MFERPTWIYDIAQYCMPCVSPVLSCESQNSKPVERNVCSGVFLSLYEYGNKEVAAVEKLMLKWTFDFKMRIITIM